MTKDYEVDIEYPLFCYAPFSDDCIQKFTEWKTLTYLPNRVQYKDLITSGQVAIVLKTGLTTWYCGYKYKEDFPGKILFVEPSFWKGTSFPNEQLKEAIKALGYLLAGDKESATRQIIDCCQAVPALLVYKLQDEDYGIYNKFFGEYWYNDYSLLIGLKTRYTFFYGKQDQLLKELNKYIRSTKKCLNDVKSMTVDRFEELKDIIEYKDYDEYIAAFTKKCEEVYSLETDVKKYLNESKQVQNLLPFADDLDVLGDYQDIPGVCKAFEADMVLNLIENEEKELSDFFSSEMF